MNLPLEILEDKTTGKKGSSSKSQFISWLEILNNTLPPGLHFQLQTHVFQTNVLHIFPSYLQTLAKGKQPIIRSSFLVWWNQNSEEIHWKSPWCHILTYNIFIAHIISPLARWSQRSQERSCIIKILNHIEFQWNHTQFEKRFIIFLDGTEDKLIS